MSDEPRLEDGEFVALMRLMDTLEPFPNSDWDHDTLDYLLDCESNARGYGRWRNALKHFRAASQGENDSGRLEEVRV